MGEFDRMLERLRRGTIDPAIEAGYERTGFIYPAFLLHCAKTPETFSTMLLEVVAAVLRGLDGYVEEKLAADPDLHRRAGSILGRACPYGDGIMEPRDLIMVRLDWRMEVIGSKITVTVWHVIKNAVQSNEQGGHCILWPPLNDTVTQFWPLRVLTEAHNCAALSLHLHASKLDPTLKP